MIEFILLTHAGREHFEFSWIPLAIVFGIGIPLIFIVAIVQAKSKSSKGLNYSSGIHTDSHEEFLKVRRHLQERGYTEGLREMHKVWVRMEKEETPQTLLEMHIQTFLKVDKGNKIEPIHTLGGL